MGETQRVRARHTAETANEQRWQYLVDLLRLGVQLLRLNIAVSAWSGADLRSL